MITEASQRLSWVMALKTFAKRVQAFIETWRIIPERRVPRIRHSLNLRMRHRRFVLIDGGGFDNRIRGTMRNQHRLADLRQEVVVAELKEIAALEPFEDSGIPGTNLNIILLAGNLDERSKATLAALATENDGFRVRGRETWVASQKASHIAFLNCAAREGAPRAIHDPQHEHDSKNSREVAVERANRKLFRARSRLLVRLGRFVKRLRPILGKSIIVTD